MPDIPPAGSHGGDGPRIARALGIDPRTILDLSQSPNPFAPDVASMLDRHLDAVRRYPDPSEAARVLAEAIGVDSPRLMLTNGGSEAIWLVAWEIGGRVWTEPEFGLHPRNPDGPVWRSDPHNPSGRLADPDEAADVWDEAFYPLATGRWTAGRAGVVVGSLTKVFAAPGLRLGYIIADDVERFARHQSQWSVNSLALAVLPELLDSADLTGWSEAIAIARKELAELLRRFGFAVEAADAPWVLVHAPGLRELLAPHGVVVRDCASFGMPEHVRVAVPDSDGLARLESAMLLSGVEAKSG
ncbi:MAG: aminotransferase class I/II-fold pyridoxal phosphate-dependent enzyme [bacterium]|nr:aminotransferase class I/II-fold pyridoxal phosphate-dependent enzyme [bacterium]